ncbi:type IV pilus biogenesis protein PilP [Erwinia piriflorinigrans]|uniref:Type IV pilus biogenesis protein PilP n=1 Tax=Erwinia piriflorinigrans CFBP 5888 TaxID=1161919 RepID=V5Z3R3_9GAMM|nr:type IV pilus biogenesis protein PilP [Erwinia piriflorinigrans]CCG85955.1 type IV pilus biogenesis protein PilP [Erwinia piriflorinigrans CFBP 5888]
MRRINPAGICLFLCILPGGPLLAAGTSDNLSPHVTIGELEAAQARNLILEQKVQTARLKQQLRESESSQSAGQNYLAAAQQPATPTITQPSASRQPDNVASDRQRDGVRLQEIYGRGTQLRARILLPNGGVTEVVKGDVIPGTSKRVIGVTATVVRLSDNTELSF